MPELPEVEATINSIAHILYRPIKQATVLQPRLRNKIPPLAQNLVGNYVIELKRRGKYILGYLSNDYLLIIHLGMTGSLTVQTSQSLYSLKHLSWFIDFADDLYLAYNDIRRFGLTDIILVSEQSQYKRLQELGLEPLDLKFNGQYLAEKASNSLQNIKTLLTDNRIVVGVGNIYANEILFAAQILPNRKANTLSLKDCNRLVTHTQAILTKAIKLGGSSIKDFISGHMQRGSFQHFLQIYSKHGSSCPRCTKAIIIKYRQNGRSTFACLSCQE